jgi:hypothetical protein
MSELESEVEGFVSDWRRPAVSGNTARPIQKVAPKHEQIINWFIANPHRRNADCAAFFGVTQTWLSTIKRSDAYKARMEQRLTEMAADVREAFIEQMDLNTLGKLGVAADIALDRLTEKLETADDPEFLLDATDKLCHRLGFAPKSTPIAVGPTNVTNNTMNISISAGDLAAARELMSGARELTRELPGALELPLEPTGS